MQVNIGSVERAIRVLLGVILIYMAYTHRLGAWAYIGIVPLLTGVIGWCPPYSLLGINTCKVKPKTDGGA